MVWVLEHGIQIELCQVFQGAFKYLRALFIMFQNDPDNDFSVEGLVSANRDFARKSHDVLA